MSLNGLKGKESDLRRSLPVQGFVEYPPGKRLGHRKKAGEAKRGNAWKNKKS